jgi:hypothetical protein
VTSRSILPIAMALALNALRCGGASSPHVLYHNPLESLDGLITKEGLTLETATFQGRTGIRIESEGRTTVRLAEVRTQGAEAVVLTYRGHLRTANLAGRAYLEMRCRIPGKGELVSSAPDASTIGTTDWATQVVRLSLGNEPVPRTVGLNVRIEGSGDVWVHNVLLAQSAR